VRQGQTQKPGDRLLFLEGVVILLIVEIRILRSDIKSVGSSILA